MHKIDVSKWQPFVVGELFDIHPTRAYKMINAELMDGGDNPIVVNSSYNNGIGGYTSMAVTEKGKMITFSDTTTADTLFYQPQDFVGYPHVQGMYPIGPYAEKWTEDSLLFFVVSFKKAAILHGFDYAHKFTRELASVLNVYLPVVDDMPDFAYMESYMRETIQKSELKLEKLSKICVGKNE